MDVSPELERARQAAIDFIQTTVLPLAERDHLAHAFLRFVEAEIRTRDPQEIMRMAAIRD